MATDRTTTACRRRSPAANIIISLSSPAYTYSHSLDNVGANWDFGAGLGLPSDSTHPGREYASSDFDIRNRGTLTITYAVPGRDGFAQMLKGWELNFHRQLSIVLSLGA